MQVTEHFAVEEFICRDGTPYPALWIEPRLRVLCEMLEIIRTELGVPLRIDSGYRTPSYNAKVDGATYSQHVQGRAADIVAKGLSAKKVHDAVLRLIQQGRLPKVRGLGRYPSFTHIDCRASERLVRWEGSRKTN